MLLHRCLDNRRVVNAKWLPGQHDAQYAMYMVSVTCITASMLVADSHVFDLDMAQV